MATNDISRFAHYIDKNYADVHMQQGRVLTDDDHNQGRRIAQQIHQHARIDLIGSSGSPDQGFSIHVARADNNGIDFKIHDGTFYIGGLLLELSETDAFKLQKNWLQYTKFTANDGNHHLVYLEAWQQPVAAVEDSELFEVAIGGPDTANRLRTMWRVELHKTDEMDCAKAWNELVKKWENAPAGEIAGKLKTGNELVPDTTLTVEFDPTNTKKSLCQPSVTGGYLGAENQSIRVQLIDKSHFTWGFDNASPLYRVQVEERTKVKMLTEPKDEAHWPRAGQVVEFLPWSAVLVNGEKLAEESMPGHFAMIESGFSPEEKKFSLTQATALPANYGEAWKKRSDSKELLKNPYNKKPLKEYLFMRVWDRGDDLTSDPQIQITNKVKLGTTGLLVTFNRQDRRPGDYWIISARPETPYKVVPWQLESERPPEGIRRFYSPLAIVEWKTGSSGLAGTVQDCRKRFRPLTEIQTCCTRIVGDGTHSHGDFNDLQEAIKSLPPSGGEICLLHGEYLLTKTVVIEYRNNITIRGCGTGSKVVAPDCNPAIRIKDCRYISISSLQFDIRDYAAVVGINNRFITLKDCHIHLYTLATSLADDTEIGRQPAVFLQGDDLLVEGNQFITTGSTGSRPLYTALGGIQIGGRSDNVVIRRNFIRGGNGNGITLGNVSYVLPSQLITLPDPYSIKSFSIQIDSSGGVEFEPAPKPKQNNTDLVPLSHGNLSGVSIADNTITGMGANGIAVAHFFDLSKGAPNPTVVKITKLKIEGNRIHECLQGALVAFPDDRGAYGGIALADVERLKIDRNTIEENGKSHIDPICGVFILFGHAVTVENNQILHNGPRVFGQPGQPAPKPPEQGHRGGIVICWAFPQMQFVPTGTRLLAAFRQSGTPAADIHNNVVIAPEGRALKLIAMGPVSVTDNQLTSQGTDSMALALPPPGTPPSTIDEVLNLLGGAAVAVANIWSLNELDLLNFMNPLAGKISFERIMKAFFLANGNITFNNNQVVLDAVDQGHTIAFSSILLVSLWDDVSMLGNQCDCYLAADAVLTNALVAGGSLRVANNRFKEGVLSFASATTLGWFNSTVNNQGTHCFIAGGHPELSDLNVTGGNYYPSKTNKAFINALPNMNCNDANYLSNELTKLFLFP